MGLTGPEKGRAHKLFQMMDVDHSGTVDLDEMVIVHDSDKESMVKILDTNQDGQVDKDEWTNYLSITKDSKGDKRFGFFLNYLEKEIPKHISELKRYQAEQKLAADAKARKTGKKKKMKVVHVKPVDVPLPEAPKYLETKMPVPESVQKKRKRDLELAQQAAVDKANDSMSRKNDRVVAYQNAAKYAKEYRALANHNIRMHRQAKAAGNHYIEPENKLIFVVRIRGLADMHPKTRKIMNLMRLRQMNMGVFMKVSKAATEMLTRVEPYVSYGYPTLKSVRDLIYKRGYGKVNKNRIPLNDNAVISGTLGQYGLHCMEDLVHEIITVGPNFREANNFLWPFKLRPAKGGQAKKRKGYNEGGQAGNRESNMNALIQRML
jgi:large subunit ribosomal protein L7e